MLLRRIFFVISNNMLYDLGWKKCACGHVTKQSQKYEEILFFLSGKQCQLFVARHWLMPQNVNKYVLFNQENGFWQILCHSH